MIRIATLCCLLLASQPVKEKAPAQTPIQKHVFEVLLKVVDDAKGTEVISWGGLEKIDKFPEKKDFNMRVRTKNRKGAFINDFITLEVRKGKPYRFYFYPAFYGNSAGGFRDVP